VGGRCRRADAGRAERANFFLFGWTVSAIVNTGTILVFELVTTAILSVLPLSLLPAY